MQTVTSVQAQNNFWQLMNTIPREPVIITKHGRNYAMVIQYEEPIEFGYTDVSSLSVETQEAYKKAKTLPKSAFVNF